MAVRKAFRFTGRVQGVGFRATSRSVAGRYAITGWVRNEPDGSVWLEAQGEETEINAFLETLGKRVEGLVESRDDMKASPVEGEEGFRIER